jgi:hypothetical protein
MTETLEWKSRRTANADRCPEPGISGCGPTGSPAGMPLFIRIPPPRLPERAAPGLRRVWFRDRAPAYIALRAT